MEEAAVSKNTNVSATASQQTKRCIPISTITYFRNQYIFFTPPPNVQKVIIIPNKNPTVNVGDIMFDRASQYWYDVSEIKNTEICVNNESYVSKISNIPAASKGGKHRTHKRHTKKRRTHKRRARK